MPLALDELAECLGEETEDRTLDELGAILSAFIRSLPKREGDIFLLRYWHLYSVKQIAAHYGFGESRVKMMLQRTREKLRKILLEKEIHV